eukprot:110550_1
MRTVFRFRPTSQSTVHPDQTSVEIDTDSSVVAINKSNGQQLEFIADCVFDTDSTQQSVFKNVGEKLIQNTLDGYNTCVFAYGQTGSGKTFTMLGKPKLGEKGILTKEKDHFIQTITVKKLEIASVEAIG